MLIKGVSKSTEKKESDLSAKTQVNIVIHVLVMILFAMSWPFFVQVDSKFGWILFFVIFSILVYLMLASVFIHHDVVSQNKSDYGEHDKHR